MNVLRLIELIDNIVFISKIKLINYVMLKLILIELLKRCNISNWLIFAFDFVVVFESIKKNLFQKNHIMILWLY